jgi:hypothetical protein
VGLTAFTHVAAGESHFEKYRPAPRPIFQITGLCGVSTRIVLANPLLPGRFGYSLPKEDALEPILPAPAGLFISTAGIHRDVLMHGLMGIEPYLIIAAPVRFTFRELNQNPTYAPSVKGRINGDIVKEEVVGFRQQDEHSYNHIVVENHPNLVSLDALAIIAQHRSWIFPIRLMYLT